MKNSSKNDGIRKGQAQLHGSAHKAPPSSKSPKQVRCTACHLWFCELLQNAHPLWAATRLKDRPQHNASDRHSPAGNQVLFDGLPGHTSAASTPPSAPNLDKPRIVELPLDEVWSSPRVSKWATGHTGWRLPARCRPPTTSRSSHIPNHRSDHCDPVPKLQRWLLRPGWGSRGNSEPLNGSIGDALSCSRRPDGSVGFNAGCGMNHGHPQEGAVYVRQTMTSQSRDVNFPGGG